MGDRDHDLSDTEISGNVSGFACDLDDGRTRHFVDDFDVRPLDALCPAGSEHFQNGFFGGPSPCVMLGGCFSRRAIEYFSLRKDSLQEDFTMLFDHLCDANTFYNVRTDADQVSCHIVWHVRTADGEFNAANSILVPGSVAGAVSGHSM